MELVSSNVFFTADTHFGHANILRTQGRPFASIEEHDEALISNWNAVVPARATVYHLGDFAFRSTVPAVDYRKRLNGRIVLIEGNHDRHDKTLPFVVDEVHQLGIIIRLNKRRITLCHYSMRTWYRMWDGGLHLYGHSHGHLPPLPGSLDVGVDCCDYRPISFEEVVERIGDFKGMTHHPSEGAA